MDEATRHARNAGWILLLGGGFKLFVALAPLSAAFNAPEGEYRGLSVLSAMLFALPIAGYGAFDLGAGYAVRRGLVAGRLMGFLSGAFALLLFFGVGLGGIEPLISYSLRSGLTGALLGAAALVALLGSAAANYYLVSALWKSGAAFKG